MAEMLTKQEQRVYDLAAAGQNVEQIRTAIGCKTRGTVYGIVGRIRNKGHDVTLVGMPPHTNNRAPYEPSEKEIQRATKRERKRWTEADYRFRSGLPRYNHWRPFEDAIIGCDLRDTDVDEYDLVDEGEQHG